MVRVEIRTQRAPIPLKLQERTLHHRVTAISGRSISLYQNGASSDLGLRLGKFKRTSLWHSTGLGVQKRLVAQGSLIAFGFRISPSRGFEIYSIWALNPKP